MLDKNPDALMEIKRLVEEKNPLKSELADVAELCHPEAMDMDGNLNEQLLNAPGHYSGLAKVNLQVFSQGSFAHMMGGDVDWMEFGEFHNKEIMESRVAQSYYEELRIVFLHNLYDDGFYDTIMPAFKGAGSMGTDCVTATPSYDDKRTDYIHWHIGDVWVGQDAGGRPDRLALKLRTTVHDLAEMGFDLSEEQARIARETPKLAERKEEIWYYYRRIREPEKYLDTKMIWEVIVLNKAGEVMHESPMRSLPGSVWRFFRRDRSAYGQGMGTLLRRDMMQSNKIQKLLMMEGEQRVLPSMWMPAGVEAYLEPGSVTYQEDMNNPQSFPRRMIETADMTGVAGLKAEIDRLSNIIFYTDFFMQLAGNTTRKTAQEVAAVWQETSAQVAVVVDTIERNFLRPLMYRSLLIMADQGRLPEPPEVIKQNTKGPLEIDFIGPLAKARRYTYSVAQDRRMIEDILAPLIGADPTILDYLDMEQYLKRATRFMGGGRSTIRPQAEVDGIRAERQMQEMMMRQAAAAQGQAQGQPQPGAPQQEVMPVG